VYCICVKTAPGPLAFVPPEISTPSVGRRNGPRYCRLCARVQPTDATKTGAPNDGTATELLWSALHGMSLLERAGRMRKEHRPAPAMGKPTGTGSFPASEPGMLVR
jgi:hypothetical protein